MSGQQMMLGGGGGQTLLGAITAAGLTASLQLCLDAGDPVSYISGQKWLDRSGNGYDFFLGADGSAAASDPTFVPIGAQSYWSLDGGDYFTYDSANETWMQNIHKNNAAFTILALIYRPASAATFLMGDDGSSIITGFELFCDTGGQIKLLVVNATATVFSASSASGAVSANGWSMAGISLNEATGAGGGFCYANGAYAQVGGSDTFNSTYSSPASGNATDTLALAARSPNTGMSASGSRVSAIAAWSTALTKANLDSIWAIMRGRFGL